MLNCADIALIYLDRKVTTNSIRINPNPSLNTVWKPKMDPFLMEVGVGSKNFRFQNSFDFDSFVGHISALLLGTISQAGTENLIYNL